MAHNTDIPGKARAGRRASRLERKCSAYPLNLDNAETMALKSVWEQDCPTGTPILHDVNEPGEYDFQAYCYNQAGRIR